MQSWNIIFFFNGRMGPWKLQCSPRPWSRKELSLLEEEPEESEQEVSSERWVRLNRQGETSWPGLECGFGKWAAKRERGSKDKTRVFRSFHTLLKSSMGTLNISGHFQQGVSTDFLTFQQYKRMTSGLATQPKTWDQPLLHLSSVFSLLTFYLLRCGVEWLTTMMWKHFAIFKCHKNMDCCH